MEKEKGLILTWDELDRNEFENLGQLPSDGKIALRHKKTKICIWRSVLNEILYRCDVADMGKTAYTPFNDTKELLNYCGIENWPQDDKKCPEKKELFVSEEYDQRIKAHNLSDKLLNSFNGLLYAENYVGAKRLKKALECEFLEKIGQFENKTGCSVTEVRFLKQNEVSRINIIAHVDGDN